MHILSKTGDVIVARYKNFMQMSGNINKVKYFSLTKKKQKTINMHNHIYEYIVYKSTYNTCTLHGYL